MTPNSSFASNSSVNKMNLEKPFLLSQDTEENLKIKLKHAYVSHDYLEQCEILRSLAQYHLQRKHYWAAAKLINGALSISRNEDFFDSKDINIRDKLIQDLNEVEVRFIEEQAGVKYSYNRTDKAYGVNSQYKKMLISLRAIVNKRVEYISSLEAKKQVVAIQKLYKFISEQMKIILNLMIEDCIFLMKAKPPCDYAFVGMGSLAREEITPYSDLEFFLLIRENNLEYRKYFKHLSQLLELKIINLGETDLIKGESLLPLGMPSPVAIGVSLDVHKKPHNDSYNLIGKPEDLVKYQLPNYFIHEPTNHLSISLSTITPITNNNEDLILNYQEGVNAIHQSLYKSTEKPLFLLQVLSILREDIKQYKPLFDSAVKSHLLNFKHYLYRPIHTIIDTFALFKNLKVNSTLDRIDALCKHNFMEVKARDCLKQAFAKVLLWRLRIYSYYKNQFEIINALPLSKITNSISFLDARNYYRLNNQEIKDLSEIYKTAQALYGSACMFYNIYDEEYFFSKSYGILAFKGKLRKSILKLNVNLFRLMGDYECNHTNDKN